MLILDQKIEVRWHGNNRKHYESLGYSFTNYGDVFLVNVEDLPLKSHSLIKAQCDFCGIVFHIAKYNYIRNQKNNPLIACEDCRTVKSKQTLQTKYGVDSPMKIDEVKRRVEETCLQKYGHKSCFGNAEIYSKGRATMLERYGSEHALKVDDFLAKAQDTCYERYGTCNVMQSQEFKDKHHNTIKERYGVDNVMELDENIAKMKNTCVLKYGGESSQCDDEVRRKSWETLKSHGYIPTSRAEIEMVALLQDIYGQDNCVPQFTLDRVCFDCLVVINDVKIDIEYDGWYWHKNRQDYDTRRDNYVIRKGYRVLRFISDTKVPTKEQIIDGVNYLVDGKHHKHIIKLIDI